MCACGGEAINELYGDEDFQGVEVQADGQALNELAEDAGLPGR